MCLPLSHVVADEVLSLLVEDLLRLQQPLRLLLLCRDIVVSPLGHELLPARAAVQPIVFVGLMFSDEITIVQEKKKHSGGLAGFRELNQVGCCQ